MSSRSFPEHSKSPLLIGGFDYPFSPNKPGETTAGFQVPGSEATDRSLRKEEALSFICKHTTTARRTSWLTATCVLRQRIWGRERVEAVIHSSSLRSGSQVWIWGWGGEGTEG